MNNKKVVYINLISYLLFFNFENKVRRTTKRIIKILLLDNKVKWNNHNGLSRTWALYIQNKVYIL